MIFKSFFSLFFILNIVCYLHWRFNNGNFYWLISFLSSWSCLKHILLVNWLHTECKYTLWWKPCGAVKEKTSHYHMLDVLPWRLPLLWLNSSFQVPGASFLGHLIQRFKVILRLKLEPAVIKCSTRFPCPYTGLCSLIFGSWLSDINIGND